MRWRDAFRGFCDTHDTKKVVAVLVLVKSITCVSNFVRLFLDLFNLKYVPNKNDQHKY